MKKFLQKLILTLLIIDSPNIAVGVYRIYIGDKDTPFYRNIMNQNIIENYKYSQKWDTIITNTSKGDLSGEAVVNHEVTTIRDNYGFSNGIPNSTPKIILLGDSFFNDPHISTSEGFQSRLNNAFGGNVSYNLGAVGCSGFRVYNEFITKRFISKPSVIILEIVERNLYNWGDIYQQLLNVEFKSVKYRYYGLDFVLGNNFSNFNFGNSNLTKNISKRNIQKIDGKDIYFYKNSVKSYTTDEISDLANNIKKASDHLKSEGIELIVLVIPDKESLYPNIFGKSTIDDFNHSLSLLSVHYLDLKALLSTNPQFYYYDGDTHWNKHAMELTVKKIHDYIVTNKLLPVSSNSF